MIGVIAHIVLLAVGYCASLCFAAEPGSRALTLWGWLERKLPSESALPKAHVTNAGLVG